MERNKRILFLADINSVHTERWVRLLKSEGLEIGLFSLSAKTSNWVDALGISYETFELGEEVVRSKGERSKMNYFKAHRNVRMFIDAFQPDIVHAHYATSYGMLARRTKFPKTVLSLWGTDVFEFPRKSPLHRWFFKRIVRSANVVCSTSIAMANEAKKYVNREYVITPFGTDIYRFCPGEANNSEDLILGTVKSLEHVYGIDRLIQIFARYVERNPKSQLHIYGKGQEKSNLQELVLDLKLEGKVKFYDFVQGNALVEAFRSLDIALFLSRSESFGVAAIEAQACGVPAIVSNVGGLPEVCADKNHIVDGEDFDGILQRIAELESEKERLSSGKEARAFVVSNYSNETCLQTFLSAYDQV